MPPPDDWIYLNNFQQENRPKYYAFPAGIGKEFKKNVYQTLQKSKMR
ncbi:MAG: AAA family ATPase [Holosporaceae bacterium]|nr:MAG: AAA family ATPase [Holosporaceae bacterium]